MLCPAAIPTGTWPLPGRRFSDAQLLSVERRLRRTTMNLLVTYARSIKLHSPYNMNVVVELGRLQD